MSCDLCGKSCAPYEMVNLLDSYKTRDVQWICGDCETEVNNKLWAMKLLMHGWYSRMLKIWIRNKRMKRATRK